MTPCASVYRADHLALSLQTLRKSEIITLLHSACEIGITKPKFFCDSDTFSFLGGTASHPGYRTEALSLGQVAELLGLSINEADGFLKARGVQLLSTLADFEDDRAALEKILPK